MPRSQPGNAAGSARVGSADQAVINASWTMSSACWKSRTWASAVPNANCWKRRVRSTKALTSPPIALLTSCSWFMAVALSHLKCRARQSTFMDNRGKLDPYLSPGGLRPICSEKQAVCMRDILEDIFGDEPLDPRQVARASLRPKTRERFYKSASVGEGAP